MTARQPAAGRSALPAGRSAPPAGRWALPVLLMAVIWFFSSQPDLSSGLGVVDLVGRKVIHAGEYALLCFLWWRALQTLLGPRAALVTAFVIAAGYGAVDEYHQTFVEGRTGSAIDFAIDASGAALAVLLLRRRHRAPGAAG
jgi:VanZ family protein